MQPEPHSAESDKTVSDNTVPENTVPDTMVPDNTPHDGATTDRDSRRSTPRGYTDVDPHDGRNETAAERSDRNWNDILQELRVTQTGTQIISGFLLTVAFQQRFPRLPGYELAIYGVLVSLAAISTLLGLSIVSIHRARFHRHEKARVVQVASRLLFVTIWVVAVLTAGVVLFIFDFVFGLAAGVIAAIVAITIILGFLLVLPLGMGRPARSRQQAETGPHRGTNPPT